MCGIFGVLNFNEVNVDFNALQDSVNIIRHRGPDDEGYAVFNTYKGTCEERFGDTSEIKKGTYILSNSQDVFNLAFGFRRLSILDLSINGHQPFFNKEKTICIIFNGEVYNYIEIREELISKGYRFRTATDTEVIMNAYTEWGEDCLNRFNGMWGMALYDIRKNILFCSRDRFGVKPFYYYKDEKNFVFASELKAIIEYFKKDSSFKKKINKEITYDYFVNNFTDHTENTFIKGIKQLPPSNFIKIHNKEFSVKKYFDIEVNKEFGKYDPGKFKSVKQNFEALLFDSVKLRLRSDVSVGTCLSGGLDSSSVVSIINKFLTEDKNFDRSQIGDKQKTFSAVYDDPLIDERNFIEEIVRATNCDSHYVFPDKAAFAEDVDKFIYQLDEPIGGTSPYAQWNVMKLAKQNKVTVLLDGQGADESLGGYEVYFAFLYSNLLKQGNYIQLISELSKNFHKGMEMLNRGFKYYRNLKSENIKSPVSQFYNPDFLINHRGRNVLEYRTKDNLNQKLYEDFSQFILPSLLRFEDRNSMMFSIESRTPFLDYRIIKYLFETEAVYKIHNGWSKWILRNSMKKFIPDKIVWRRDKKGFPTPERKWMMRLKDDFVNTVQGNRDELNLFFNIELILNSYDEIISNPEIKSHFLWKIYNFAKWKKMYSAEL
ncbi:MAG: asparagine synthase (glutamine-hydrolyzing) [Bacteroidota bacterium]|nr:asparagine synthase (glutamine-hydrolyzing) [Bacteroidota bacterium]